MLKMKGVFSTALHATYIRSFCKSMHANINLHALALFVWTSPAIIYLFELVKHSLQPQVETDDGLRALEPTLTSSSAGDARLARRHVVAMRVRRLRKA